jgi:hypothetical protein
MKNALRVSRRSFLLGTTATLSFFMAGMGFQTTRDTYDYEDIGDHWFRVTARTFRKDEFLREMKMVLPNGEQPLSMRNFGMRDMPDGSTEFTAEMQDFYGSMNGGPTWTEIEEKIEDNRMFFAYGHPDFMGELFSTVV